MQAHNPMESLDCPAFTGDAVAAPATLTAPTPPNTWQAVWVGQTVSVSVLQAAVDGGMLFPELTDEDGEFPLQQT